MQGLRFVHRFSVVPALAIAFSWAAVAEADAEPIHLVYRAHAGCPDASAFAEEVLRRTEKARVVEEPAAKRTFVATVRANGDRFEGRLEIKTPSEATTARDVTGKTCGAVASALAFVAALAIDPDSAHEDRAQVSGVVGDSGAARPRPPLAPGTTRLAPGTMTRSEAPPAEAREWRWRAGLRGEGHGFIAPEYALGIGAFVDRAASPSSGRDLVAIHAWRLSAHYARTGTIRNQAGAAHFDWATFGADVCPLAVDWGTRAGLGVCTGLDAGLLRGQRDGGVDLPTAIRFWLNARASARIHLFLSDVWFVETDLGIGAPLRRDRFIFEGPTSVLYEVPAAGFGASVAIGYRIGDRAPRLRP
ncbi:MAG TPA: hypothetical protein VJT73_20205 [Polyangiaceae bacterium]|nr:hypothetical protein [Polyangiaceae bacterium]